MRRRAIIHIGWPRTGTTSFQFLLDRLRPDLATAGILYPDLTPAAAPQPHLNHQHLGETFDGRSPVAARKELLARLDDALAATRCDTVILSYEGLIQLREAGPAAETLAALFLRRGFVPEIAATVKPQAGFLNSAYTWRCQFLRESRLLAAYARNEMGSPRLDYGASLSPWHAAMPGGLCLVPMRDGRSDRPLMIRLFDDLGLLDRVGPLLTDADVTRRENPSPGPVAVAASRWLHHHGVAKILGSEARAAGRFLEVAARSIGRDQSGFWGVDSALLQQVEARFHGANDALARDVWGCPWAERVAPDPAREVNEIQGDEPDVQAVVRATLDQFSLVRRHGPRAWFGRRWARAATP